MQNLVEGGPHATMPLSPLHEGEASVVPEEELFASLPRLPENLDGVWTSQDVIAERLNQLQQMDDATEVTFDVRLRGKMISVILSKSDIMTILDTAAQHQAAGTSKVSDHKKEAAIRALNNSNSQIWWNLPTKDSGFQKIGQCGDCSLHPEYNRQEEGPKTCRTC